MKQKKITVKNTFYGDTMELIKISRPLKFYYNVHGQPYFNYRKTRYYLCDVLRLDYKYKYTDSNNNERSIVGFYGSYYSPFYVELIDGYDPKIVLYEKIYQPV